MCHFGLALAMSATVSVVEQKCGGDSFQPIGSVRGRPTSGSSPLCDGKLMASFGASDAFTQILWNPSAVSISDRKTGPKRGLALWMHCGTLCGARPNCTASLGACKRVSSLMPKKEQVHVARGHRSRCGTTPDGLKRSTIASASSRAVSVAHCPLCVMSANSCRKKAVCSFADLWRPRLMAASFLPHDHGSVVVATGAPIMRKVSSNGAAGCGKRLTSA